MRGTVRQRSSISRQVTPDELAPSDHRVRKEKVLVDHALAAPSPTFNEMCSKKGGLRPTRTAAEGYDADGVPPHPL